MDGNFSFFALPDPAGTSPEKLQVDTEGNPLRKRQPHHKSRSGCATCKRRKVKVCILKLPELSSTVLVRTGRKTDTETSATKQHLLV